MLLSIGYPVLPNVQIRTTVEKYRENIGEIYFAWSNAPSGRMPSSPEIQAQLENDLPIFRELGIKLCLLVNGNCYGADAVSKKFAQNIERTMNEIKDIAGDLDSVTTTSPFAAHVIKNKSPEIEVKASVNMRIGTKEGMTYLKDSFDSFYVQREHNRDFARLLELREWADKNGKKLYGLLNSGCLNFCSNQSFHDNMVSHEKELAAQESLPGFNPVVCHKFYSDPKNRKNAAKHGNWIRPEDLHCYEKFFDGGKLATRMHMQACKVIGAYARSSWPGNLADLLEPRFSELFIDNRSFSENWLTEL